MEQRRVLVGVGSSSCSYFPGQTNPLASGCSEHADCGSDEYCYDVGYFMTGEWNGVGYCSGFPTHCCGDAHGDPIDRDAANCPAASQCGSETATASNCERVCEGHGYDAAQCTAVSQSCQWHNGACWSGVGSNPCEYYSSGSATKPPTPNPPTCRIPQRIKSSTRSSRSSPCARSSSSRVDVVAPTLKNHPIVRGRVILLRQLFRRARLSRASHPQPAARLKIPIEFEYLQ